MSDFSRAFAAARKAGKKTFKWNGKSYHTRTKEDEDKAKAAKKKGDGVKASKRPPSSKSDDSGPKTRAKVKPKAKTKAPAKSKSAGLASGLKAKAEAKVKAKAEAKAKAKPKAKPKAKAPAKDKKGVEKPKRYSVGKNKAPRADYGTPGKRTGF